MNFSMFTRIFLYIQYFIICNTLTSNATKPILVSILDKMKSDKNLCEFPSDELKNSELLTICGRPLSFKHKDIRDYLKFDFVPLLCMALYDTSLRLCDLHPEFKNKIPRTEDSFKKLINNLEKSDKYSNIENFCSSVDTYNSTLLDRKNGSSDTADWINFFNNALKDKDYCQKVCINTGLGGPSKVHPICSFIIWSNSLISESVQAKPSEKNQEVNEADQRSGSQLTGIAGDTKQAEQGDKTKINVPEDFQKTIDKVPDTSVFPEGNVESNQGEDTVPGGKSNNDNKDNLEKIKTELQSVDQVSPNNKKNNETKSEITTILNSQNNFPSAVEGSDAEKKVEVDTKMEEKHPKTGGVSNDSVLLSQSDVKENVLQPSETKNSAEQKEDDGNNNYNNVPAPEIDHSFKDDKEGEEEPDDENNMEAILNPLINQDSDNPLSPPKDNGAPNIQIVQQSISEGKLSLTAPNNFINAEDSHFFTNFISLAVLCIIAYIVFHNKKKLLALAVEGKRRGPTRRRPNTASYSKLDCNLEEAMVSNSTASVTHVLY